MSCLLSVVVPCYNEEEALPHFVPEIQKTADELLRTCSLLTEFLFIDDGSRDGTLELLRKYAGEDTRIQTRPTTGARRPLSKALPTPQDRLRGSPSA